MAPFVEPRSRMLSLRQRLGVTLATRASRSPGATSRAFVFAPAATRIRARQPLRQLSSSAPRQPAVDLEHAAMLDLLQGPTAGDAEADMDDAMVFVLATAEEGGVGNLVLLSTRCPETQRYMITLPFAQIRGREDTGLAAARALIQAGIRSSSVIRNGSSAVAIHPGGYTGRVVVESMTIQSLDGIGEAENADVAVVMAPVANLRMALENLSNEGRLIDDNLYFFASGMEAVSGGIRGPAASPTSPAGGRAATGGPDFVTKYAPAIGAVWMAGAVCYGLSCMTFAY